MARRKVARSQPQTWLESDIVNLLAWLDFTRNHPDVKFEDTIVGQLNNKYTFQKVKYRLNKLWIDHGPDVVPAGTTAQSQYEALGSKALHDDSRGLDDSIKEQIAEALADLEATHNNDSQQASLTPSRRLRSSSRFESKQPNESRSPRTVCDVDGEQEMLWSERSKSSLSLPQKTTKVACEDARTYSSSPTTGEKRKRKQTMGNARSEIGLSVRTARIRAKEKKVLRGRNMALTSTKTRLHKSTANARPIPTRRQRSMTIYDSERSLSDSEYEEVKGAIHPPNSAHGHDTGPQKDDDELQESEEETICSCKNKKDAAKGDWMRCDGCDAWGHIKCYKYVCVRCLTPTAAVRSQIESGTQASLSCINCDHGDHRLRGAVIQIEALKGKVVEKDLELLGLETDIQNMERKVSTLKGAQERRDAQRERPVEAEMAKLLEERDKLQRDLTERIALGAFTRLGTNPPLRREVRGIVTKLQEMYIYMDKCIAGIDDISIASDLQLGQFPDLEGLAHNVIDASKTERTDQLKSLWQAPSGIVLKALMSSAVREWVFYSDFPCFDGDTSHTLRVYRESIVKLDGPLALRNLDLASMERLVSEPVFHNITIPEESGRLANRLSVALAPLFQQDSTSAIRTAWDGFATWQSSPEEAKDRQDYLTKMFACALRAKAESCLNFEWYEMVIYAPETPFDPKTMSVQTMDGMKVSSGRHTHGKIHVCVEPALFAFPREDPSHIDNMSECIMSGRNFKTQEQRKFEPLMKAVVVLS